MIEIIQGEISVNSRLQVLGGNTYLGGKFDAFFNVFFCILGVFLGGNLGFWGEFSQEIAGNNTGRDHDRWGIRADTEAVEFIY